MKRFWMVLSMLLVSFSLLISTTAEAKRFGGGSSAGKQRTVDSQPAQKAPTSPAATPNTPPTNAPATPPASGASKWLGPLAGLAIGAGLGALLASSGLGGALGGILLAILAAVAIMFVVAKLRKAKQPSTESSGGMQYAGAGAPYQPAAQPSTQNTQATPPVSQLNWNMGGGSTAAAATAAPVRQIPADFPVDSFLRSAKTTFIRLQAANDRKDLNDIREYTTPEMFAEISMQMQERGQTPQQTNVMNVNAELLEVVTEGQLAIASVRFTAQLSENNGPIENVDEIWHVQKDLQNDKAVWLLTGIQQTTLH